MSQNFKSEKQQHSEKKHILILGGGVMQLPAIRIAKKKGWRVILADANPQAPGIPLADNFEPVDLKDKEKMTAVALAYRERNELDGVFTAGTDFSTTVAWVAEKCGLPGIPYNVALAASDKILMRRTFKEHNVPCPDFVALEARDDPAAYLHQVPLPVVIKPADNMGSRGVRRVDTLLDLKQAFCLALQASRSGRVIMEAFMSGEELSVDALVAEGEIHICGVADRHIFFPPYFVELGHTMPSALDESVLNEALDVFKAGVRALGITGGAAKGDIKLTPDGPMIGEIAARLSGGYMSGWTYPYASGVEVTAAALNLAVGLPLGDIKPRTMQVSAERAFISLPGTIADINGEKQVKEIPGIKDLFLRVTPGVKTVFPTNNVEKAGNVITQAPTRAEAIAAAEKGLVAINLRLKADDPETNRFLFQEHTPPYYGSIDFSNLNLPANRQALNTMPVYISTPPLDEKAAIFIQPLPQWAEEKAAPWYGISFQAALQSVLDITQVSLLATPPQRMLPANTLVLGRLFWQAFLRGGRQGGIYIIDTVRQRLKTGTLVQGAAGDLEETFWKK
jgi:biotin carboxylase